MLCNFHSTSVLTYFPSSPTKTAAQFVCFLSALMLVLSCLLICFNPRDEIEVELLKTGVMTDDDVEAIRRLKESRSVTEKRGIRISFESLNTLKKEQRSKDKMFGLTRKRMNRVSPTSEG